MGGALPWSFRSKATQTGPRALIFFSVTALGCGAGRLPGLSDSGEQQADTSQAIADAAPDASAKTDTPVGIGGAAGGSRNGGAAGRGGVPGAGGRGLGGQGGAVGPPTICTGEVVVARAIRDPAEVLLVLDRSESMTTNIGSGCTCGPSTQPCGSTTGCATRWSSLVAAIDVALSSTPFLHWGLKLFASPNADGCAVSSGVEVPIGPDSADEIRARIAATAPSTNTPTASAVTVSADYLETLTDSKSKVMLLATDGEPNCGSDLVGTVKAIAAAREAGFLVYVIGIGPSVPNLDAFAQAGGSSRYYPADSPEDLTNALVSVSKAALCTFTLASMPLGPTNIVVYLDNSVVAQDASNGWSFGKDSLTILLHGSSCHQALDEPDSVVQVVFGCGPPLPPKTLP